MSSLSKYHICFYSEKCKDCHDLSNIIGSTPINNQFVKINVDYNRNLPKSIKSVPTLIIPNHPQPLCGQSAFMWAKSMQQQTQAQNAVGNVHPPQQNNMPPQQTGPPKSEDDNIQPFVASEMSGNFSDGFSFIDNDNPLTHQFSFLNSSESEQSMATSQPQSTGNARTDARIESMDNEYERLMQSRNNDMTVSPPIERR